MKRIVALLCLLSIVAAMQGQSTPAVTLYVSVSGKDTNPGTIDKPLAGVSKANEIARKYAGKKAVTICIRQGTYYITEPVTHTGDCSGTAAYPITYTSYKGEQVTISTAHVLKGLRWAPVEGGIYKARVTASRGLVFDRLFVNGRLQPQARYPNYDKNIRHFNGYAPDAVSPARVKGWKNPAGGILHAMHKHEWGGYQYLIEGKKDSENLILNGGFQNNRPMGMHEEYRMVENIKEELDAENEWFYDSSEAALYYYPPAGLNLQTALFEIPQLESVIELKGTEQKPVQYITFSGLTLTRTLRTFMKTNEPLLRSDWMIYRGGAVYFEGTDHCSIDNCHVTDVGGNGIFLSGYNRNTDISKCHIENIGASAVCLVGSPDAVRSPSFRYADYVPYAQLDKEKGPLTNTYPMHCLVDNNLIHNVGLVEKQVAGVQISMAKNITVSRNSIYNLPRAGINISEGTWGGHLIEGNDVFNTVLETGDHGSFNSWGRDRFWIAKRANMDSITSAHPELILLDAVETTVIRNNRWQCFHGWDIDLDDGSSNYHIYNNVCLNGGLKLREGFHRTVENNIILNNSFHPHVWFENSGDVFRHNIVTRRYYPIAVNHWGKEIDHNLFPDADAFNKARVEGTDAQSLTGNPLFCNPQAGDYRVQPASPALKVGFKNFDTSSFGVQCDRLKALAQKPVLPELTYTETIADDEVFRWLGISLKNITTEGERSATGMARAEGVLILEVPAQSVFAQAGIQKNSVITACNTQSIKNRTDLEKAIADSRPGQPVQLAVFQNQETQTFHITPPVK